MKYRTRHGLVWSEVERIQCAPDREARPRIEMDTKKREIANAFRL